MNDNLKKLAGASTTKVESVIPKLPTVNLGRIEKANKRAELIANIIASYGWENTPENIEKANNLISDCYDYTYKLYNVE